MQSSYGSSRAARSTAPLIMLFAGFGILLALLLRPAAANPITIQNVSQLHEVLRLNSGDADTSPRQFALSPDGERLLVTTAYINELWQLTDGTKQTMDLRFSGGSVPLVFFNHDQPVVMFANWQTSVRFLDMQTGATIQGFEDFTAKDIQWDWTISPDQQWFVTSHEEALSVVNIQTGQIRYTIPAPKGYVFRRPNPTFSPDGSILATALKQTDAALWDIFLWDAATGALLKHLGHFAGLVYAITFSQDGTLLAVGGGALLSTQQNSLYQLWDLITDRELMDWAGEGLSVTEMLLTPDNHYLVAHDYGSLSLWDVRTMLETGVAHQLLYLYGHGGTSADSVMALSRDGRLLAVNTRVGTILIYDVASGRLLKRLRGHQSYINSLVFSDDGRFLISAADDKTVRFWSVERAGVYPAPADQPETTLPAPVITPTIPPPAPGGG